MRVKPVADDSLWDASKIALTRVFNAHNSELRWEIWPPFRV